MLQISIIPGCQLAALIPPLQQQLCLLRQWWRRQRRQARLQQQRVPGPRQAHRALCCRLRSGYEAWRDGGTKPAGMAGTS